MKRDYFSRRPYCCKPGDAKADCGCNRAIAPETMARLFAINAIGPVLLMKHFLPLLPRHGRALFATISAKVGSIGDNWLGGWYSYRASKAALNQLVRTAAIELLRTHPQAVCAAVHPGTVATPLSSPFAKNRLDVLSPADAAQDLLAGFARLSPQESGGFFDRHGVPLPLLIPFGSLIDDLRKRTVLFRLGRRPASSGPRLFRNTLVSRPCVGTHSARPYTDTQVRKLRADFKRDRFASVARPTGHRPS